MVVRERQALECLCGVELEDVAVQVVRGIQAEIGVRTVEWRPILSDFVLCRLGDRLACVVLRGVPVAQTLSEALRTPSE